MSWTFRDLQKAGIIIEPTDIGPTVFQTMVGGSKKILIDLFLRRTEPRDPALEQKINLIAGPEPVRKKIIWIRDSYGNPIGIK